MPSHRDRRRRVAARAAQHELAPADDAHHRIVDRPDDRPVVDEEQVGDRGRAGRAPRPRRWRWARRVSVAAGRDDGKAELAHQQVMQRRIGQQRTEPGIAGRDRRRDRSPCPAQQHDRPRRRRRAALPPRPRHGSSQRCRPARGTSRRTASPARCLRLRSRRTALRCGRRRRDGNRRSL